MWKTQIMLSYPLQKAFEYCEQNQFRLTRPRARVLEIIAASSKPLGAYEILAELAKTENNPKPPTVYRELEFWKEHGFIHKIESLNAYLTCDADHQHQGSQFLLCDICGDVIEAHICSLPNALQERVARNSFKPSSWNFEVHGVCSDCR